MHKLFINKKTIRREYLLIRKNIPQTEVIEKSQIISNNLFNLIEYKKCETLFVYLNTGKETITEGIINTAIKDKKNVALPVISKDSTNEMVFIQIDSLDGLIINKYGIKEPEYDKNKILLNDKNTFIVVPGVVFSKNGKRIGQGGGYYDRYLADKTFLLRAGLCFHCQLNDDIPSDAFDVKMDVIITEMGVFYA